MLATKEKSSVTHAKDFCEKNAPKSPDSEEEQFSNR
jgi:hypothetical protein